MVLGKPKLRVKDEIASFSRCRNITGKPPNFWGAPLTQSHAHFSCNIWTGSTLQIVQVSSRKCIEKEKAQLSQYNRVTLHIILYKSI